MDFSHAVTAILAKMEEQQRIMEAIQRDLAALLYAINAQAGQHPTEAETLRTPRRKVEQDASTRKGKTG